MKRKIKARYISGLILVLKSEEVNAFTLAKKNK